MLNCEFTQFNNALQHTEDTYIIPEILLNYWRKNNAKPVAVDCGAHIGEFEIVHKNIFDSFYCFEPSSEARIEIHKNLKKENIQNWITFPYACSNLSHKPVKLFKNKNNWSEANSIINSGKFSSNDFTDIYENCETICLEDILKITRNINYLKVDIEMCEYDFLYNKKLKNIDCIALEIHKCLFGEIKDNLIKWIEQNNFYIFKQGSATHWEGIFINRKINE